MRSLGLLRGLVVPQAASARCGASLLFGVVIAGAGCTPFSGSGSGQVRVTSFAPLVQEVMPAVVNVSAIEKARRAAANSEPGNSVNPVEDQELADLPPAALDELLRKFFDEQERRSSPRLPGLALGSGFIVDPRGYIVTDDHVLENAESITVTFHDTTQHKAKIIGRDPLTDLALLKIDTPHPLPCVAWGDSDAVRVGDWVLAIGNPFGLDDTVSSGIISARGRDIHAGPYDDFLQIDASINRGNSGGPTFDLEGKVIGINSAIYSPNGGSVGIGFAIPANLARPVVDQLLEHGKVERGWLGVQIQPVTPEIADGLGLPGPRGALVAAVTAAGPAAHAGVVQGDVILMVNRRPIERMRDLPLIVAEMPVGRTAEVTLWRRNQQISLYPVIGLMPGEPQVSDLPSPQTPPSVKPIPDIAAGLKLAPLSAQLRQRLQLPKDVGGAVVTAITEGSPFAAIDLSPGDVIEMIDQEPVASPRDILAKLRGAAARGVTTIVMLVNRHGSNRYVALGLGDRSQPDGPG
jgi:serine protease Do